MSKPCETWMPFYVKDFEQDTSHLTAAEVGAYFRLLLKYWASGPLPDDDVRLALICRLSAEQWATVSEQVRAFFHIQDDGLLHQKRADKERAKATHQKRQATHPGLAEKLAEAGRRGGLARAEARKRLAEGQEKASERLGLGPLQESRQINDIASHPSLPSPLPSSVQEEKREKDSSPYNPPPPPPARSPSARSTATKGSRLPEGWMPSGEMVEFASDLRLPADVIAAEFRDYWIACPGAKGVKLDWSATWRNWCRRAASEKRFANGAGLRASLEPENEYAWLDRDKARSESIQREQREREAAARKKRDAEEQQWLTEQRSKPENLGKSDEQITQEARDWFSREVAALRKQPLYEMAAAGSA